MRFSLGPEFRGEWARFGFRFYCEECSHFDPSREQCVHEYPNEEHRRRFYEDEACRELVFCKEFELF